MPWKVECPICGAVVNRDDMDEHIKEHDDDISKQKHDS